MDGYDHVPLAPALMNPVGNPDTFLTSMVGDSFFAAVFSDGFAALLDECVGRFAISRSSVLKLQPRSLRPKPKSAHQETV